MEYTGEEPYQDLYIKTTGPVSDKYKPMFWVGTKSDDINNSEYSEYSDDLGSINNGPRGTCGNIINSKNNMGWELIKEQPYPDDPEYEKTADLFGTNKKYHSYIIALVDYEQTNTGSTSNIASNKQSLMKGPIQRVSIQTYTCNLAKMEAGETTFNLFNFVELNPIVGEKNWKVPEENPEIKITAYGVQANGLDSENVYTEIDEGKNNNKISTLMTENVLKTYKLAAPDLSN